MNIALYFLFFRKRNVNSLFNSKQVDNSEKNDVKEQTNN